MKLNLNKKRSGLIGIIFIFLTLIILVNFNKKEEPQINETRTAKKVSVIVIGDESQSQNYISAVGSVKADSKIAIVAMQSATVRNVYFNVGDSVSTGQRLATLSENSISTSLLNAQNEYSNRLNSLEIVKNSTNQDIQSSEINSANSAEALELSKIQLKAAEDNYNNGLIQIEKNKIDLKNNSVITYNNNLSVLFDSLNQIDYIIDVDNVKQIPGIENVIAAKNKQTLDKSKRSYVEAKTCYLSLLSKTPTPENALSSTKDSIACVQKLKTAIDDLIIVLENTISSSDFSEITLNAQISNFNQLRISTLSMESKTKNLQQTIENIEINSKADFDRLKNSLAIAQNQVNLSEISYKNSLLGLKKTTSLKDQQILSAQIAVDSTRGQLNLALERAGDLNISSPIRGVVTKKSVELGEEVSPGKVIAEVSQLDLMKILINLPSEEAYKVKIGQEVIIEKEFSGIISQINPAADSLSKKVEIEIAFDNKDKNLIAETFVNVEIPVEKQIFSNNGFLLIPLKSVSISQNENYVFVVVNNLAVKKDVQIGEVQNDLIEIKSGIDSGMTLVIDGNKNLNNEDMVETN